MHSRPSFWTAALALVAVVGAIFVASPQRAEALVAAEFDPGYIVSDSVFFNSSAMNEAQIQEFLQAKVPACRGAYGAPCLRDYSEPTVSRAASPGGQCTAYEGSPGESASRIIFKVAQACGINPQVLLVTLQKERGLVTKTSPIGADYRVSMGYGCPDTAACDTFYYGFYNQLYRAAWQFREYTLHPLSWRYKVGTIPIQYNPNPDCGAPLVAVRNQATANLYNYTPYQPNAAAMANLGGIGDSCSAYGNRNFWVYFSNWFGSPIGAVNPIGTLDSVTSTPGGVRLTGWAFDPDTTAPIDVHVYINGVGTPITANLPRPDVDAAYGGVGAAHGFDVVIPVTAPGRQDVCIYGINQGPGTNSLLKCATVTTPGGSPMGYLDLVSAAPGTISYGGWAIDPDTGDPIDVHVYVDSAGTAYSAADARPDVAAAYPGYGPAHGFSATIPATAGPHRVCAYGINVGTGSNVQLGCKTVTVPSGSPIGVLDSVVAGSGSISVNGWAIDPDTAAPIPVHVYVGPAGVAYVADKGRPDVGRVYPTYGDAHGFSETIPSAPGRYTVCAYAINAEGPGGNTVLGCRDVTV